VHRRGRKPDLTLRRRLIGPGREAGL
jgi:hypothetical protein